MTLPLGISFYTFQTMSYTIDVYRGDMPAERNFIDFGAFVVLFPQLIAGPIVRYSDIRTEMHERRLTLAQTEAGVRLFLLGLASKVLIANNIGSLWTDVEEIGFASISTPLAWMAVLAYSLQLYFDFSGYSLMAIGLGKMLGFEFPKNFDFPYESKSITEFWTRWHMTLGAWFREYVYYPLGGNRKGKRRQILNLFIVWAFTGLWHGAAWNFVIWGLFFFVILLFEKRFLLETLKKSRIWPHLYVLFLVALSWAIFAVTDLSALGTLFSKLFGFVGGGDWQYFLRNYAVTFVLASVFSTQLLKRPFERLTQNKWVATIVYGALFFVCICYLVDATYNPFLYFRF
jgi:alginate O-acetyltransferase complex protein AlgI